MLEIKTSKLHDNEVDLQRWVVPFYLQFLHGNFVSPSMHHEETQEQWNERVRVALRQITPEIAGDLLGENTWGWRGKQTGAWFCGLKKWDFLTLDIGRALIRRQDIISTQGYSFALARFASHASANYLRGQMNRVLKDLNYDNESAWLIGSMMWVDYKIGTSHADDYIGLWQQRLRRRAQENENYGASYTDVEVARERFWGIMRYVEEQFDGV